MQACTAGRTREEKWTISGGVWMISVGCCGFPRAHHIYFDQLRLIEIQQTFYKPPQAKTAYRWRAKEAPPDFVFTLKAWQLITHQPASPTYRKIKHTIPENKRHRYGGFRPTDEVFAAWEQTREIASALRAHVVVFQCPVSFTPTDFHKKHMRLFFQTIKRDGLQAAWEPRGEWKDPEVEHLCTSLDLIHCVDPFMRLPVTRGTAYFRLHGIGGYAYRYTNEELEQLKRWCQQFEHAYVLFNNTSMWEDGFRFRKIISST